MTIKHLKEIIADLPDDMRVYADNGFTILKGEEFLCGFGITNGRNSKDPDYEERFVLQTKRDFNVVEELEAMCEYVMENDIDEQDFWTVFVERGFKPEDFADAEREAWAKEQLENYGLL